MNLFLYTAAVAELNTCKRASKAEQLVHKYVSALEQTAFRYSYTSSANSEYDYCKFYYKLVALALKTHAKLSTANLPDKLHDAHSSVQRNLFNVLLDPKASEYLVTDELNISHCRSYNEFMDLFEFDEVLTLPSYVGCIEELDKIIGANPIHFKVVWNPRLTSFDNYSTILPTVMRQYAYAMRHKQVNYPNEPRTIWDQFLADSVCTDDIDQIEHNVTRLEQQIKALNTIKDHHESV